MLSATLVYTAEHLYEKCEGGGTNSAYSHNYELTLFEPTDSELTRFCDIMGVAKPTYRSKYYPLFSKTVRAGLRSQFSGDLTILTNLLSQSLIWQEAKPNTSGFYCSMERALGNGQLIVYEITNYPRYKYRARYKSV